MAKIITNLKRGQLKFTLIMVFFLAVASTIIWVWLSDRIVNNTIITQIQNEQLILAKTASLTIEEFLRSKENIILGIINDDEPKDALTKYMSNRTLNKPGVIGIGIFDKTGKIISLKETNYQGDLATKDVTAVDRDYFLYFQKFFNKDKFYLTDMLNARLGEYQGKPVFFLSTGIYDKQDKFNGVITMSINPSYFTENFVNPLKFHADSRVFIFNSDFTVVTSIYPEMIGRNLITYADNSPDNKWPARQEYINNLKRIVTLGGSGTLEWDWLAPNTDKFLHYMVTYNQLNLTSEEKWYLVIATPNKAITTVLDPISFINNIGMITRIIFILIIIILIDISYHIARRDGYQKAIEDLVQKKTQGK